MKHFLILLALFAFVNPAFAKHHHHKKTYHVKKYKHKHRKGLRRGIHASKFLKETKHITFIAAPVNAIPGSADISKKVSPPEDQGQCGACWDFSLTKALRSAWMVAGKDPGQLEFNYLLNNCGPGPQMYGCNGGDFDAAQSFANPSGPGLNANNPYTQQQGAGCMNQPVAATSVSYAMLGMGNGPSFKDLAYAVGVENQMLSIDVAAGSGDWEGYSGGIYNGCSGNANQIDHMIDMVGYNCETSVDSAGNCVFDNNGEPANGDGYLLVENNWGTQWGEGGYMRTRFMVDGEKCNAIATNALMFTVNAPPVPPKPPAPPVPVPPAPPVNSCHGFLCGIFCFLPWCS